MTYNDVINDWEDILSKGDAPIGEHWGVSVTTKLAKETFDMLNRQKAEIERYKGVIKILENDVKVASIEAVKGFAHFLIDRSKGGEIEVVDVADLAVEYMNTFGGNKDEQ